MEIKVENIRQVSCCPMRRASVLIKKCGSCPFFECIKKGDVVCNFDAIDINKIHVTSFMNGDDKYESRDYNEDVDGKIEGDDPYDYCQKCDMLKKTPSGKEFCALRTGVKMDDITPFVCYESEIWKKVDNDV